MKKFLITVNGKQYEVDCEEVSTGSVQTVKSSTPAASVVPVTAATLVSAEASVAPVVAEAPVAKSVSPGKEGSIKITAPMPGAIVKIEVSAGDSVKSGQNLVILEAMKMENEIKAPQDGVVASVNTSKGSSVESGELLVTLE